MPYLSTADWIAFFTLLATLIGVFVVWKQTRKLSQQLTLQQFADYTKRYQEIILHFPEDINTKEFVLKGRKDYEKTMRYMRAYLDLCYEEWYLHNRGFLDEKLWGVWKSGINAAFSKPAFQQAWQIIKDDSKFGADFETFVDQCIRNIDDALS